MCPLPACHVHLSSKMFFDALAVVYKISGPQFPEVQRQSVVIFRLKANNLGYGRQAFILTVDEQQYLNDSGASRAQFSVVIDNTAA